MSFLQKGGCQDTCPCQSWQPAGQTVTLTGQCKELFISCSHHNPRQGQGRCRDGWGREPCWFHSDIQAYDSSHICICHPAEVHSPITSHKSYAPFKRKVKIHFLSHTSHSPILKSLIRPEATVLDSAEWKLSIIPESFIGQPALNLRALHWTVCI